MWRQFQYWRQRAERERLLREEMDSHIAMLAAAFEEEGMDRDAAKDAARRRFGSGLRYAEECRRMWIAQWASDLSQDAVYAFRSIRRQPGVAIVAMVSSALGIAACALIFAVANQALFRLLPVESPARVVSVYGKSLLKGKTGQSMSYPDIEDLRQAGAFAALTAFFHIPATISTNGEPQRYWGMVTQANYFDVARPGFLLGRGFDAGRDDRPGENPVVVLSCRLWRSRFAADAGILGRPIVMNGHKVTVIGVTREGFRGTEAMLYADFWTPFSFYDTLPGADRRRLLDRGGQWLMATARLRDGVSLATASAEVDGLGQRMRSTYPATNKNRAYQVQIAGQVNPGLRGIVGVFFLMLLIVAGLVHLTSCANVANLLLARASARGREIATRLAIGAGRGRLVRQLLTESVILALPGGVAGYGIAATGISALGLARLPLTAPIDLSIALDWRVVLFAAVLSVATGIVFGLIPALRATKAGLLDALKEDAVRLGTWRRFGLRNMLVVAQVAICMVLLICSGLFLRSLQSAYRIDVGFEPRNLLLASFDPSLHGQTPDASWRIVERILQEARTLPGVRTAALANNVPLQMEKVQNAFTPEAEEANDVRERLTADIYVISRGFFETFGIRILEGEDFPEGSPSEDIALVNQELAKKAFPGRTPIGRRIHYQGRTVRITGVVATAKSRTIGEEPHACLYFPLASERKENEAMSGLTLVLRTARDPAGYMTVVRETIRSADPGLAVFHLRTMDQQLFEALTMARLTAWLFGLAGGIGLAIAAVGLFGVISFSVSRRTKEIGIRMALGAKRSEVLAMVLGQGMRLSVIGVAVGIGLALALSRLAAGLLYGVSPADAVTFTIVPLLLILIAMAACFVPARRAASLDPLRALRHE